MKDERLKGINGRTYYTGKRVVVPPILRIFDDLDRYFRMDGVDQSLHRTSVVPARLSIVPDRADRGYKPGRSPEAKT